MQRKIEIIRSLIHDPIVLFLDEPTQGLDPLSRHSLWEYINEKRKEYGTTVFLTTHYIDEAENVDKVCLIQEGKIVFSGSPQMMKTQTHGSTLENAYINLLTPEARNERH
jgi:ABC-2 type transport system ATP-binding protein